MADATNVIYNGSFSNINGTAYGWVPHNIGITPTHNDLYGNHFIFSKETSIPYRYEYAPPGLYQKIDLTNYSKQLELTIKYNVDINPDAGERKEDLTAFLYLYKAESSSTTKIDLTDTTRDAIVKEELYIDRWDESNNVSSTYRPATGTVTITVDPGYYVIGVGAPYTFFNDSRYIVTGDLFGLTVKSMEATVEELLRLPKIDLVTEEDFTASSSVVDTIEQALSSNDVIGNLENVPINLGDSAMGLGFNTRITKDKAKSSRFGYRSLFTVLEYEYSNEENLDEFNCLIDFWYRSDTATSFYVYIYNRSMMQDELLIEVPISNNKWTHYTYDFEIYSDEYEFIIIPPVETYDTGDLFFVTNIELSITTSQSTGEGTFNEPYDQYDGYVVYNYHSTGDYYYPTFSFYGSRPGSGFYAKIDNKYYKDNSGKLCYDGFYTQTGTKVTTTIKETDLPNLRYFFKDGTMAIDESFVYDEYIYLADEVGVCIGTGTLIDAIDVYVEGYKNMPLQQLDIPIGMSINVVATFIKSSPPIELTIESGNPEIVKPALFDLNYSEDSYSYSNASNTFEIQAQNIGRTSVTISYKNLAGKIIYRTFYVEVRSISEYYTYGQPPTLEFLYDENHIHDSLQILHNILPRKSASLPIEWHVNNNSFAITNDGLLYVESISDNTVYTSCEVTACQYGSGLKETCTIHYHKTLNIPVGINVVYADYKLTVGSIGKVRVSTYGEDGTTNKVKQNVSWESLDPTIATVDQKGNVYALKKGYVTLKCTCLDDSAVSKEITIQVVGDNVIGLREIVLNMSEASLMFSEDGDGKESHEFLSCSFYPVSTTERLVKWESDDEKLVKVDQNGKIYCPRNLTASDIGKFTYVRCKSMHNPDIEAVCKVYVYNYENFVPRIYIQDTASGYSFSPMTLSFGVSNCSYVKYDENSIKVFITYKPNISTCKVTYSFDLPTGIIEFTPDAAGTFDIKVQCSYSFIDSNKAISDTCRVSIQTGAYTPIFSKQLELCYALSNETLILRYEVTNETVSNFLHQIIVTQEVVENGVNKIKSEVIDTYAQPLIYNNESYYYVFVKGIISNGRSGTIKARVFNAGETYADSNVIEVTVPSIANKKGSLEESKGIYDVVKNDLVNYIKALINDNALTGNERNEFISRYTLFCYIYENLKDRLDDCIKHINNNIQLDQNTMASLAQGTSSIAVASYSLDEGTSSNYKNITDMDYYQNECIKQLIARVTELEAILNNLINEKGDDQN